MNALKYRNPEVAPVVEIKVADKGNEWLFSFSDDDIGIEEQFFSKILVLFKRLQNRDEYPGTGIGLAICKKILESHSGRIWVESVPETGSTFYFTLRKRW